MGSSFWFFFSIVFGDKKEMEQGSDKELIRNATFKLERYMQKFQLESV